MKPTDQKKQKQALIEGHLYLVDRLANRLIPRLPQNIDIEDVKSAGILGLLDAAEKFDLQKGQSFKTYAQIRIQGSMIDELRQQDFLPRSMRQKYNHFQKTNQNLSNQLGRKPSFTEIAQAMGVSIEECTKIAQYQNLSKAVSIDEPLSTQDDRTLADKIPDLQQGLLDEVSLDEENLQLLEKAILMLNEKQRMMIQYYYFEQLKLKEIAEIYKLTESRISQILSQATAQLKVFMERMRQEK